MSSDNNSDGFMDDDPMLSSITGIDGDYDGLPTAEDGDALADLLSTDVADHDDEETSSQQEQGQWGQQHDRTHYHYDGFHIAEKESPRLSSATTTSASSYNDSGAAQQITSGTAINPSAGTFSVAAPSKFPPSSHQSHQPMLSNQPKMAAAVAVGRSKHPPAAAAGMPPPPSASTYASKMPPPIYHPHPTPPPYTAMNVTSHPAHYSSDCPQPQFMSPRQRRPAYLPLNAAGAGGGSPAVTKFATNVAAAKSCAAKVKATKTKAFLLPSTQVSLQPKISSVSKVPSTSSPSASKPPAASVAPSSKLKSPPPNPTPKHKVLCNDTITPNSKTPHLYKPLIDPNVVPAVHSIITLLQTYGPLSYEQLKFNMVPQLVSVHSAVLLSPKSDQSKQSQQQQPSGNIARKRNRLQKVLDLLHELGVINLVDKRKLKEGGVGNDMTESAKTALSKSSQGVEVTKSSTSAAAVTASKGEAAGKEGVPLANNNSTVPSVDDDPNPIYCFGNGIPRMDVVLPSQVLDEIKEAGEEVLRMKQRIEILRNALRVRDHAAEAAGEKSMGANAGTPGATTAAAAATTNGKQSNPHNKRKQQIVNKQKQAFAILKQLFELHPEIARDPVYAAALRMFKINVGTKVDHHRMTMDNTPEMDKVINAGINFNAGRFGVGKKRMPGTTPASLGGGSGVGGAGVEVIVKKKRKKGRPPKNAHNNSADKLKSGAPPMEVPAASANASWI